MVILNCHSITKPQILASSSPLHTNNPSPSPHVGSNKLSKVVKDRSSHKKLQLEKRKGDNAPQPSVMEIERAIGAGFYRDRDPINEVDENRGFFGNFVAKSIGKDESSVERKLRETGEWLIDQNEKNSQRAGKQILLTMFIWILPMWMLAFLLASGIVQLPFNTPYLEDLLL